MNIPWIVKNEPKTLEEMVLNVITRSRLEFVASNLCSAILHGPPGTGKGTFMNVLKLQAKQRGTKYNLYWINAGIEGKIDVVRNKIKKYNQSGPMGFMMAGESRRTPR